MDLDFYRMREGHERVAAARSLDAETRAAHLALADRYRAVIEAYEQVEKIAPTQRLSA